jgi:CTP:phosphocholine cytidylyltransferase-like protein
MRSSKYDLTQIINALPTKIKNEILEEHHETLALYKELLDIIADKNFDALTILLPTVIKSSIIIHHFCKSCKPFQLLFDKYQLELVENGDQELYACFAKEWMYIYHASSGETYVSQ